MLRFRCPNSELSYFLSSHDLRELSHERKKTSMGMKSLKRVLQCLKIPKRINGSTAAWQDPSI
jgi:hypothetical protein